MASLAAHCVQEIDELFKIFKVLGTPNDRLWPGVTRFPDFKQTFPKWPPRAIHEVRPARQGQHHVA